MHTTVDKHQDICKISILWLYVIEKSFCFINDKVYKQNKFRCLKDFVISKNSILQVIFHTCFSLNGTWLYKCLLERLHDATGINLLAIEPRAVFFNFLLLGGYGTTRYLLLPYKFVFSRSDPFLAEFNTRLWW